MSTDRSDDMGDHVSTGTITGTDTDTDTSHRPAGRVALSTLIGVGVLVSLFLAAVVSYFASEHPDGLESVAEGLGFDHAAEDSAVAGGPLADYGTAGVENAWLSTAISGIVGVLVTGLVAFALMRLLARSKR